MLLQALTKYYEDLAAKDGVPQRGWCRAKVSFSVEIDQDGKLLAISSLRMQRQRGKKVVDVPQIRKVPEQVKKASGIVSQFLCENAAYFFGLYDEEKMATFAAETKRTKTIQRAKDSFKACAEKHLKILRGVDSPAANAVKNFFQHWDVCHAGQNNVLQTMKKELLQGGNCLFFFCGDFVQNDPAIQAAWEEYLQQNKEGVVKRQCLVTGRLAPIARLHPVIKGVVGAQTAGASLVSFNAPAYESYGKDKEQGLNAPISEYAAFAYTTALNALLADSERVLRISDTTLVGWAEDADPNRQDLVFSCMGNETVLSNDKLYAILSSWEEGREIDYDNVRLSYDNTFYILGIAPNAARLSVRFFIKDKFGNFLRHAKEHFERTRIEKPKTEPEIYIPLWKMLGETVNQKSQDKKPLPSMAGSVLRAILTGVKYPVSLYQQILERLKAENGNVTYRKAGMIKGYLLKNGMNKWEGLTVSLNEETTEKPYVAGRLFSVFEHLQEAANPGINATIKDRYFNSACATPANIFPILEKLATHHLRKLEKGSRIYFEKQIGALMDKIAMEPPVLPRIFSLEEQGVFFLGYYHQTQRRYQKKEEEK